MELVPLACTHVRNEVDLVPLACEDGVILGRYSFKTYYSVFFFFRLFFKIIILYFGGPHFSLIIFALYSLGQFH